MQRSYSAPSNESFLWHQCVFPILNQQKWCNVWMWEERRLREGWCRIQLKTSAVTDSHGAFCCINQFACLLPCHEPMWLWMKRFILARLECLIFSSDLQVLVHHHQICWILEMMIQLTYLLLKRICLLLHLYFCLSDFIVFFNCFINMNISSFLFKVWHYFNGKICLDTPCLD